MKSDFNIERLFDLPARGKTLFPDKVAFCSRKGGHWTKYTFSEYFEKSNQVSYALLIQGVKKGDNIVTISRNRAEFNFVDMGIMQAGAVHVPIYTTISDEKLTEILNDLSCAIVFAGNTHVYNKLTLLRDKIPTLKLIVSFDEIPGTFCFENFLRMGIENKNNSLLEEIKSSTKPTDISSITYISGNTTEVRGVEHSHNGQVQNLLALTQSTSITLEMSLLSLLPLAHIYERSINYCIQYVGATVWYNENFGMIEHELHEIHPDVIFTVPLLLEKLYNLLISKTRPKRKWRKRLFKTAINFALYNERDNENIFNSIQRKLCDIFLFSEFREILGGNLKMIYCGGAGLDERLRRFIENIGIPCYEGYGLSEGGVVTHNFKGNCRPSTLGKAVFNNQLLIAADGELLIKSPSVLTDFFNRPGELAHALDADGWLHTGDKASLDAQGYLRLTGVKKRIFKLSSGIYSDPLAIEKALEKSPAIKKAFVFGANSDSLLALLCPDFEYLETIKPSLFAEFSDRNQIVKNEQIRSIVQDLVNAYNSANRLSEHIGNFFLTADDWTIGNVLLDASGGINRENLFEKYNTEVDLLFKEAAFRFRK